MPPRTRPAELPAEEVFDVHSVHDSSPESIQSQGSAAAAVYTTNMQVDTEVDELPSETSDMEEVDIDEGQEAAIDDGDADMEDVDVEPAAPDVRDMYAAAYHEAQLLPTEADGDTETGGDEEAVPIFKDGKGQHKGVEISMGASKQQKAATKKSTNLLTPRDRLNRINAHKLYVLSILAHTRVRNKWCNDEALRDYLAELVPDRLHNKLRTIHPKKITEQRERIRVFESFLAELLNWWSGNFKLDSQMTPASALRQPDQDIALGILPGPGRCINGWMVESAAERDERHIRERKLARAAKGNAPPKPMEITIFAPGSAIRPVYLRLLPPVEVISSAQDLLTRAVERSGSRETSAQLFCALCRSLGIPARLVVSPQPMPWSMGASKLANTAQPGSLAEKKENKLRTKAKKGSKPTEPRFAAKPLDEFTSDDDDDDVPSSSVRASSVASAGSSASARSVASSVVAEAPKTDLTKKAVLGAARQTRQAAKQAEVIVLDDSDASSTTSFAPLPQPPPAKKRKGAAVAKSIGKAKGKAKEDAIEVDDDYRPEKWKNLKKPIEIKPKVKLRAYQSKQLKPTEMATADMAVVDLQAPPTMWVEVFSKPYQKWITVDPIRPLVRPTGNRYMEPAPSDKLNKLVYVVGFEEDGYARDVTARYTRTLNSRVSRLRPPTRAKSESDWWSGMVKALHRPQKLDRDAMEDAELADHSSREPMPTSLAGFKDHPIYIIEKDLKRDEVLFPRRQIATFQGAPVFSRGDVLVLRSARQWYNEGKVVKEGEVALKFVKSRGYTLANKRAEEQARSEGRDVAQEGLYAEYQTELYVAPPVGADGVVHTNAFGNVDLFVPSMLPAGAVHLELAGVAKVARKLGVPHAEAVVGFEFRKQRGMPKISGIVLAADRSAAVEAAYWVEQEAAVAKAAEKRLVRSMRNWRRLIGAVRVADRIAIDYQ